MAHSRIQSVWTRYRTALAGLFDVMRRQVVDLAARTDLARAQERILAAIDGLRSVHVDGVTVLSMKQEEQAAEIAALRVEAGDLRAEIGLLRVDLADFRAEIVLLRVARSAGEKP